MLSTLLLVKIHAQTGELIICFLICQALILFTYYSFKSEKSQTLPWILMLVVCLTYYIDTDYFTYRLDFEHGLANLGKKETLYVLIAELAGWNYVMWRFLIWGTALLLYYLTSRRLELKPNIAIYTLVALFMSLFAYGRVILAMTAYFFGFSFLTKPMEYRRTASYAIGILFVCFSYFCHRSFLPIILLTPIFLLPMTKRKLIIIVCLVPGLVFLINYVFQAFLASEIQMSDTFSTFQAAAERTAGLSSKSGRNWKSMLLYQVRLFSFYVPCFYILYKFYFTKTLYVVDEYILKYVTAITIIVMLAMGILYGLHTGNSEVTGMRYLYMAGIPECLLLAYLYQKEQISLRVFNLLLATGFICTEGNLILYTFINTVFK